MTAHEYLERYREAERIARLSRNEYQKELELIDAVGSTLSGDGIPTGGVKKLTESKAIRLADRAKEVQEAEIEALRIRREVYDVIRTVPGIGANILYGYYIDFKSWGDVAKSVGYSKRHVFRIRDESLEKINLVIKCH